MLEFKDGEKSIEDESSDASIENTDANTKQFDMDDPYGLLDSEHIAAAAEGAAAVSRKEKGRKRKYKTEEERREANRKLAAASRQRKKAHVEKLLEEIETLQKENEQLRIDNARLRAEESYNPPSSLAAVVRNMSSQNSLGDHSQPSPVLHDALAQSLAKRPKNNSVPSSLNTKHMTRQSAPIIPKCNDVFGLVNKVPTSINKNTSDLQLSSNSSVSSMSNPGDMEHICAKQTSRSDDADFQRQLLDKMTMQYLTSLHKFQR